MAFSLHYCFALIRVNHFQQRLPALIFPPLSFYDLLIKMSNEIVCPKGFLLISFQWQGNTFKMSQDCGDISLSRVSAVNSVTRPPQPPAPDPEEARRHPGHSQHRPPGLPCGLLWNQWKSILSFMIASFDQKCMQSRKCSFKWCHSWWWDKKGLCHSYDDKMYRIIHSLGLVQSQYKSIFSFLIKLFNSVQFLSKS